MLIECPNCNAGFQVPERLLVDQARPLRCGQCQAVFPVPDPPAPEPVAWRAPEPPPPRVVEEPTPTPVTEELLPEPEPAAETLAEAANEASARRLRAAWAASIMLLIGGGLTAIIKRDVVMQAWPPAARLFAALGLS